MTSTGETILETFSMLQEETRKCKTVVKATFHGVIKFVTSVFKVDWN